MGTVIVLDEDTVMGFVNNAVTGGSITVDGELVLEKPEGVTVNLGTVTDHGTLLGIADDDHTQYALADGSRGDFATEAQGALADAARPNQQAELDFVAGSATSFLEEVTVSDDGTSTSGWINRLVGYFRPEGASDALRRMVFWWNEYLELRLAPAKHNTVAARIFVRDTSTTQTTARDPDVPLLEMMDDRVNRNKIWGLYPNGNIRVAANAIPTAHIIVLGAADSIPTGTPAGTVVVRTA